MTIYATAVRCDVHRDCWNALAEDLEKGSGIMHDFRLVHGSRKPAAAYTVPRLCDERCTEAKGDDCECSCGGKNHGVFAK